MIFLRMLLALCVFVTPAVAATLATNGESKYFICTANDPTPPQQTAARDLQDYLQQVTGAKIAIFEESQGPTNQPAIMLGGSKRAAKLYDAKSLGPDGIVIKTIGDDLLLAGAEPRGTLYSVYTFLEDYVGVRWWTSSETFVPYRPTLPIPSIDISYTPKLRYREAYYLDAIHDHPQFDAHLKLNGQHNRIGAELGGHQAILGWCHTFHALLPPDKYFAQHPEWYSLVNGKRTGDGAQLCLTNDAMREELVKNALQWIAKDPSAGIISISQNDWLGACECEKCSAIVKEEGAQSGNIIRFVNKVADEITQKYPDFLVETLAYQWSRKPPAKVHPNSHVLVRLCSIEADQARPLASEANKSFGDDLRRWSEISPNLFIWNYVTNFSNYLIPQPNLVPLGEDLKFFIDHNVVGVFEQGDAYNAAGDMLPLRVWLLAHLMWDPSRDQAKLVDEFLNGYFGKAAPQMREYLQLVNEPAQSPKFHRGCFGGDASFLSNVAVDKAEELFADALHAVGEDKDLRSRIERERLVVRHIRLLRYDFSARGAADAYPRDADSYAADAKAAGVRDISEGAPFDSYVPGLLARGVTAEDPKFPAAGTKLPDGQFDIQQDQFKLYRKGELVEIVDDADASDGKAARLKGGHTEWAVQYHVPADAKFAGKGPWKCFIVARVEAKKPVTPFQFGMFQTKGGHFIARDSASAKRATDGKYHAYGMRVSHLGPGEYFWIAPTGSADVTAVYVDRIFIMRDDAKK